MLHAMIRLWKDFWGGFKFANLGVKRLFLLGLIIVPIAVFNMVRINDCYSSFKDWFTSAFMSFASYLVIVRITRWVCDGFMLRKQISILAHPTPINESCTAAIESTNKVDYKKTRFYHYPSSFRTGLSWILAFIAGLLVLAGSSFLFQLPDMGSSSMWAATISMGCLVGAMLLDVFRYMFSPLSTSRYISTVVYTLFWVLCLFMWACLWSAWNNATTLEISSDYQRLHWYFYTSIIATGFAVAIRAIRKTGYKTNRRRRAIIFRIIIAGGIAGFFIVLGTLPMRDYELDRRQMWYKQHGEQQ